MTILRLPFGEARSGIPPCLISFYFSICLIFFQVCFYMYTLTSLIRGASERQAPIPERPGPFHERPGPFPGRPGQSPERPRVFTGRMRPFPERQRPSVNRHESSPERLALFSARSRQFSNMHDLFPGGPRMFTERIEQFLGRPIAFLEMEEFHMHGFGQSPERHGLFLADGQRPFVWSFQEFVGRPQFIRERSQVITQTPQSSSEGRTYFIGTARSLSERLEPFLFRPGPFSGLFRSRRALIRDRTGPFNV